MIKTLLITALLLSSQAWAIPCYVERVHDIDTFTCRGFKSNIRVFGADGPEVKPPVGTRAIRKEDKFQPYAFEARDYMAARILNKWVELDCGHGVSNERFVCIVKQNGVDLGGDAIKSGRAIQDARFTTKYTKEQEYARNNKLGVWGLVNGFETPKHYRDRLRAEMKARKK